MASRCCLPNGVAGSRIQGSTDFASCPVVLPEGPPNQSSKLLIEAQ